MPDALTEAFARRFGGRPTHRVSSPGRVNLIGEHVDYAGLPVLPMAIARGITLAVRPRPDARVRIANAGTGLGEREFHVSEAIEPFETGDWGNYPKAAVQGLARAGYRVQGFDAVLTSDLPAAAGLSSSSALVVATALAVLADGGLPTAATDHSQGAGRLKLAAVLAGAEHYVGARGGGMDQAAILAGRAGHALHVRFDPLRVRPLPVPDDWRFVVAHSLAGAEKSAGARETYNARRAEVEDGFAALGGPAADLLGARAVEDLLAEAASILPAGLATRVRHVLTEHDRVARAVVAMEAGAAPEFGRLMLASHASLRDDFGVSTTALDELVEAAGRSGALGARLTGAGLGGCIVALVRRGGEDALIAGLRARFYGPQGARSDRDHLFVAGSAEGARVFAV